MCVEGCMSNIIYKNWIWSVVNYLNVVVYREGDEVFGNFLVILLGVSD